MKEYAVKIVETLERVVYVQADNGENAREMVKEKWYQGEYILDADDFKDVEYYVVNTESEE